MASSEIDIESLLADILDDDKPLPKPTVAQAVINTQLNATGNKAGDVAMDNPEDFLESLMNDEPAAPTPMDVAQAAEIGGEIALAEAGIDEPETVDEALAGMTEDELRSAVQQVGVNVGQVTQRVTKAKEEIAKVIANGAVSETAVAPVPRDEIAEAMEAHGLAPKRLLNRPTSEEIKEIVQTVKDQIEVEEVMDEADAAVAALFGDTPTQPTSKQAALDRALTQAGAAAKAAMATPAPGDLDSVFADSSEREEGAAVQPLKMPTFTAADFASTMDIRNFATLVTLNTARWHAKVKDRQASKDAAAVSEAEEGAFETRKHLLGGANAALKAIHKAIDEARAAHYEMTLPWTTTSMQDIGRRTGGRLLPNTLFVEYTTVMAAKKQQMLDALSKFEPAYPTLIEEAKKKLGKRFDAREYPNVSSIRQHFDLSFDFQPIPKGDDFKGLPKVQLDALARKINDNTQKQAEHAMQEVWVRLHEAVSRMAERLSSPDKLFHDSLVQNVRDVARLLAHLNVTQDAKVEALRKSVEKHLCQHEAKVLRTNMTIRAQVGAHAVSIIQEMDK